MKIYMSQQKHNWTISTPTVVKSESDIKMKMLDYKIDILEDDPKKYADIAFLVDKESFLKDIKIFRDEWTGGKTVQSVNSFESKLHDESTDKLRDYKYDIRYILSKYKRHKGYYDAVREALLTGKVSKDTYTHTYWTKGGEKKHDDDFMSYGLPIIHISNQSTYKDVKKLFIEAKDYLRVEKPDVYNKYFDKYTKKAKKLKEIIEDRHAYWSYMLAEDKSRGIYERLTHIIGNEIDRFQDESTLRKAILRYKNTLNSK